MRSTRRTFGDARDQHHSENRRGGAQKLSHRQPFAQNDRREQKNKGRLHIITHRGDRHRRIGIRLKKQDPVDSDECARKNQEKKVFAIDLFFRFCRFGVLLCQKTPDKAQKKTSDHAPHEGEHSRRKENIAAKNADRAEDQHGGYQLKISFCVVLLHRCFAPKILYRHSITPNAKKVKEDKEMPAFAGTSYYAVFSLSFES